jgi:hypothetical protein
LLTSSSSWEEARVSERRMPWLTTIGQLQLSATNCAMSFSVGEAIQSSRNTCNN